MPCTSPLPAAYSGKFTKAGKMDIIIYPRTPFNLEFHKMRVPCSKCYSCRLKRSRDWAIRCMHEAKSYSDNCFITLTYNNAHLPPFNSLVKRDFQLFMKRLRKRYGKGIRYYYCGEYGGLYGRPHYHALLFNFSFDFDKYFWQKSSSGSDLYRSPSLESLWADASGHSIGYSSVADLTFDSAAYVARYVMKKISGDASLTHYAVFDDESGEIFADKLPEFNDMSRRPGIGRVWFDKYYKDVYSSDKVVFKGLKIQPPKYYDKCFELISPEDMFHIKQQRQAGVEVLSEKRLSNISKCVSRRVDRLIRSIDNDLL